MKRIIVIGALLMSTTAKAMQFELGAGLRQYQPAPNGIWYQRGFGYDLHLTGPVVSFGFGGTLRPWLRYGVRYLDLGSESSNSTDTPSDANYNGANGCVGRCWPLANYVGHGSVQGVAFTLQPQYRIARHLYSFVEGGAFLYRPLWGVTVYHFCSSRTAPPQTISVQHHALLQVGWTLGAGVRYRHTSIAFDLYDTQTTGDQWTSISPTAYTLMLREDF